MKGKLFLVLLLTLLLSGALRPGSPDPEREKVLGKMIANWLANWHYSGMKIDDDFSARSFAQYTRYLDNGRNFLVQADLEALRGYADKIDDELQAGDFAVTRLGRQLLVQRVQQAQGFARETLAKPFDFTIDEQIELDPDKRGTCRDLGELRAWWRKWLKYLTLTQYINLQKTALKTPAAGAAGARENGPPPEAAPFSPELEAKARQAVGRSVERLFSRLLRERSEEMQSLFFNSLTASFDPHSQYFPPRAKEDFDIEMSGTLEGIGALLGEDDGFVKIFEIIPGSPAWIQGILKAEDVILKVGQGGEEPVDVVGMSVSDAARLVRGRKGSSVRLTVRKPDGRILTVSLVRNVVELQETYARSAVLTDDQLKRSFGYVYLPRFYHDFNRANGRNAADDVGREVRRLAGRGVEGIVLDLRGNGGGALEDAVRTSGLFIEKGPVVQVKDRHSAPQVYEDRDGEISWDGPLVVLVNSFSASASEIVAAALQDYRRAVVVGDHTFGKGTVQVMLDLDRYLAPDMARLKPLGALTLTVQKYYRITGGSTQYQGVVPDILLPDLYAYLEVGEKSQKNSLPWDTVPSLSFSEWKDGRTGLAELQRRSQQRLAASDRFRRLAESVETLRKQRQKTQATLNLKKFLAEQDALFRQAEERKSEETPFPYLHAVAAGEGPEAGDEAKRKEWLADLCQDPVIEESLRILGDMKAAAPAL